MIFRISFLIFSNVVFWIGVEKFKQKKKLQGVLLITLSLVLAVISLY
jgi:hypothetical protein